MHGNATRKPKYNYLKETKLSFFFSLFFFYKNREQEGRTGSFSGDGVSGKGEDMRKGYRRVNMM
jgi:hypothetical protein